MATKVTTPYHSTDARVHLTADERTTLCGAEMPVVRWWGAGSRGDDGELIRGVWFKHVRTDGGPYGPRCQACAAAAGRET